MEKAIYALSADPITYGHIDIVERAADIFDEVLVRIGVNADKNYMFSEEERVEMARKALEGLPNVNVDSFRGLLVDYAYEQGVDTIVKGVRNDADRSYEDTLIKIGKTQQPSIETKLLEARPELAHISSSAVKAIQKEQGLIHEYVPLHVKQGLEARVSGQYIVGVSGEIGCGKSYVGKRFEELGETESQRYLGKKCN